jgi:hypothetical protein
MNEALKAKLDEARKRMNSQQAGINANRKHDDPAMREWARGKQRPANIERAQFRASLTDEDRSQIEERIEQLVRDNPMISPVHVRTLGSRTEPPSVPVEVLEEYHFLRDMVADGRFTVARRAHSTSAIQAKRSCAVQGWEACADWYCGRLDSGKATMLVS